MRNYIYSLLLVSATAVSGEDVHLKEEQIQNKQAAIVFNDVYSTGDWIAYQPNASKLRQRVFEKKSNAIAQRIDADLNEKFKAALSRQLETGSF